ncbi:Codeine O-demethylase-like protein [Drosera capensis]
MGEGYAPSAAVELPSKMVQEISDSGDAVPEKYIHKELSSIDPESLPWMPSEVVNDLQQLLLDSPSELHKFRSALLSWGCFQVVNHGMTSSFLDEVREINKQFFVLPSEEKQKYMRPVDDFEGYGNDTEVLGEFSIKSQAVLKAVIKAMERSLDLKDGSVGDQYGENGMIFSRFNFYPRCSLPDQVLGIKSHTDGSALTILLQDKEVEGLQVLKDDQWFKVPVIPLFIDVGDQCEIMSNGMFKSPVHRVVTNSERERVSVAMFCIQ